MMAPPMYAILLVLISGVSSPAPTPAQDPTLTGSYRLVPEQSDPVEDAVEAATDGAGFFVRTVGRRMLTGKLTPTEQLRITVTDTLVVVSSDEDRERATVMVSGPDEGDPSRGSAWWDGAVLVVRFTEEEGTRVHRYALDPDGRTLRVEVRVSGDRLPRPVELSLTYARSGPAPDAQGSEN
jgi:hypothetical protein